MTTQYAFHYNTDICTGCKTCVGACKDILNDYVGLKHRRVIDYVGGSWTVDRNTAAPSGVFAYSVSISCMHCQNPACVEVCPTTAMKKRDDGIVWVDESLCVGCRYCELACPYGAPKLNEETHVMSKCNFCKDLIDNGESPACVAACPMRAIDFGELTELQQKYGDVRTIATLPSEETTNPSAIFTVSRWASSATSDAVISNPKEELI